MEAQSLENGIKFTWVEGETLTELQEPKRIDQIKTDYEKRRIREMAKRKRNPLDPDEFLDDDELFGQGKICVSCHK